MRYSLLVVTVFAYLGVIVASNLVIEEYGKEAVLYVGAAGIGFVIVARDVLHELFGSDRLQRLWKMALLIGTGALLSYLVNGDAATIAKASAVAFAASEAVDFVVYDLMLRRPWLERSNASNVLSATVDTVIFMQIAFGSVPVELAFAQVACKVAGGLVYTLLLQRREVATA